MMLKEKIVNAINYVFVILSLLLLLVIGVGFSICVIKLLSIVFYMR